MVNHVLRKLSLIISVSIYSALTTYTGLVYAEGITPVDKKITPVITTANKVDIVNIATPSTGGVSQNKFTEFSIDANGAVMNNSLVNGTSTLAGQIKANANLTGGSASIILNEVTSNQRSNLNGDTEIFGGSARYILSNPNGITCNGCGFIRTPTGGATDTTIKDVLLTTGKANLTPTTNLPITFTIDRNNTSTLIIGAGGLDARNVDITTLLTRKAEINGIVEAASNKLFFYLGKGTGTFSVVNDVAATTWSADNSGGGNINVAIDANSAGAMYAGQIFIQATEDGAGVTLDGDLVSTGDGISITAEGDIVYKNAKATIDVVDVSTLGAKAGSVEVKANGAGSKITANGNTTAATGITLSASNDITYNNVKTDEGDVTVSTTESNAQITTRGDTTATTGNITWNISGNRALVTSSNNPSTFTAGNTILFNCLAGEGTCDIQSQRELILKATLLSSNANISTTTGRDLTVNANVTTSQGFNSGGSIIMAAKTGNISIAKDLIAANSISLTSAENAQIILNGNVQSGGDISFLGKGHYTHDNVGSFSIGGDYLFDITSLTNKATLADLKNGVLYVKTLDNQGLIENLQTLTLHVDDSLTNSGIIASLEGGVSIGNRDASKKTNSINNSGLIASIDITHSQLGQTGLLIDPAGAIKLHTQAILNGEQRSAEDLAILIQRLNTEQIELNNANAPVTGVVSIRANTLNNSASGRISGSDVSIQMDTLNNQGGQIIAGRNLSFTGVDLNNNSINGQFGVLTARDNLNIELSRTFTNTGLVDASNVNVNAPTQDNIGSGFSIASLLGTRLDTSSQVTTVSQKPWFEVGTGNSLYQFIDAFNTKSSSTNLTRLNDTFIQSSGARINAKNKLVGDDIYIAELLVNTLRSQGGVPFVTAERDALGQLNTLYNNTQDFMNKTGLGFGQVPDVTQQQKIKAPILVFVAQLQNNGDKVYVPQLWMPSSGEGINAQAGRISTQIMASNNLYLEGDVITSHDADLIAGENLVVKAVDFTISGDTRKWYVDANGQVHYHTAQMVAGDSVLVELSGNYVQEGGQVLAANQLVVQAKKINVSNKTKANFNRVVSFNSATTGSPQLWTSLLGLGLKHASQKAKRKLANQNHTSQNNNAISNISGSTNMLAKSVLLKAEDDITLTRTDIRSSDHNNAGSLMLIADKGSISNLGGSLTSNNIYMQAGKDITNKSLIEVQNNGTRVKGRWNYSNWSSDDNHSYTQTRVRSQSVKTDQAEINAGSGGLVQIAGNDINNLGGLINSGADIVQQAEGNITNKSLATTYLENQRTQLTGTRNGWYGSRAPPRNLKTTSSTTKYNTSIQLAGISAKGNLLQNAGNKIINVGSTTSAKGNILQSAKNGIENTNLITSNSTRTYKTYTRPRGYAYGYDNGYYGYNRSRSRNRNRNTNTLNTTQNANINSITAGGSLIVNVEEGDYLNQGNLKAKNQLQITANNITNTRQIIGSGLKTRLINSGKITAGEGISLIAKADINDTAGRYQSDGNIIFNAAGNITQNVLTISKTNNRSNYSGWGYRSGYNNQSSTTHTAGEINAGGAVSLNAGNNLTLTASNINAQNIDLRAENITLNAAANTQSSQYRSGRTYASSSSVTHDVVELNSSGNMLLDAKQDLTSQGSLLTAGNQSNNYLMLNAGGDMMLDGVNNKTYSYYHTSSRSWHGGSKSTTRVRRNVTLAETELSTGGSVLFNIDNEGVRKSGNVTLTGTKITAGQDATLYAGGKLNILSGIEYSFKRDESHKSGFGGISKSGSITKEQAQSLGHAVIESGGNTNLLAAGDINVVAGKITASNIVADAGYGTDEDVEASINIIGEKEALATFEHKYKTGLTFDLDDGFLSLAEETHNRDWKRSSTYVGSSLIAQNNITLRANSDINLIGSKIQAMNSLVAKAGQDINILSGISSSHSKQEEENIKIGIGLTTTKDSFEIFAGAKTKRTGQEQDNIMSSGQFADSDGNSNLAGSSILASSISLNAQQDITIAGADLMTWETTGSVDQLNEFAQQDHAGVGNIKLTAGRDITTLASINKTKLLDYEESLRVGLRISAQQNVSRAAKSVDTAKTEGGLANNLRAVDSIQAAKDGAVSGSAGIVAEYARSESEQEQQSLRGSLFSAANDLSFTSGNNQTHLGTQATAANDLKIKTGGDLMITSAQDLASSQADSFSASVEYGFGTKQAGVSGSLAFSTSKSGNMDHRNAQFNAGNTLVLDVKKDATIKGAVLKANTIKANIEGNLTLASLQDTSKVRAENANVSASTSGSFGFGGGYTKGDKTWVKQQTGLIAKNELDLNVKKHTQLDGAIINSESGQLNFSTNTLAYSDLHDSDTFDNQQVSFGFTTPDKAKKDGKLRGKTFDYQSQSHDLKQITRATIGAGNITVNNGTADGINRDASKAQTITRDTEDKVDIYYSDSSYDIVHNTVAANGDYDLIDVVRPDLFVAEVAGSTIRGIDQIDNAIVDGFTFNSGENFNGKNRGLLTDSTMLDLSKKAEAGVKAATAGLMRYTKKDGTKSFIGSATTYEQRFEALYSGKNLNEVLRKSSDTVDKTNNLSDENAQGVQDTLGQLSIAAGNKDKNTLVYNNETSSLAKNAKGYSTDKDIGINTDRTDINNVRDVISTVAHENSDHKQHKNGEAGEALATLMGNETAYQWVNDNRKEGRYTGGYKGTSTADWREQNNSQQSELFDKNNARVSKTNPNEMEYRQLHSEEYNWINRNAASFAKQQCKYGNCISIDQAKARLTGQAFRQVQFGVEGKWDKDAQKYLRKAHGLIHSGKEIVRDANGPFTMFFANPNERSNATIFADHYQNNLTQFVDAGLKQPNRGQIVAHAKDHGEYNEKMAKLTMALPFISGGIVLAPVAAGSPIIGEIALFSKNPVGYCLYNVGGCTVAASELVYAAGGAVSTSAVLPALKPSKVVKLFGNPPNTKEYVKALNPLNMEQLLVKDQSAASILSGKNVVTNKVDNISMIEFESILGQRYAGVKEASQYLQDAGVPRYIRKQVLQSFDVKTLYLRQASNNEFGIRYFDNVNAWEKGRYLFETFPASRQNLALKPEWNQMTFMKQFQIRPNTTILEGRASSMGSGVEGSQPQKYILNLNDLLEP